jgi:uncharacterized protein
MKTEKFSDEIPDKRITGFLKKHHVLTLATSANNTPYCCSCFYVYDEAKNVFIFTSDLPTRHAREMLDNKRVAIAVALETSMVGKIQGVQICGDVKELKDEDFRKAKKTYLTKFPIAAFSELVLWEVSPDFIKLTDNRLGFGKKLIWEKITK